MSANRSGPPRGDARRAKTTPKAPAEPFDARLVRKLADILNDTGLSEIEVERGDLKIRVARTVSAPALYRPSLTYSARDGLLPSFSATLCQSSSKSSVLTFSPFGFGSSPAARTASRNVGNSASTL